MSKYTYGGVTMKEEMRYLIRMESIEITEECTNIEYELLATIEDRKLKKVYAVLFSQSGYLVKPAYYQKDEITIDWKSVVKQQTCNYLVTLYEEKEEELYQEEYLEQYGIDPNSVLGIRTNFSSCLRSTGPPPVYCLGIYYSYFDLMACYEQLYS